MIISQASALLPVVAGWLYFRKLNRSFRILFYFFLSCIGFEIMAYSMRVIYNNNMPGLHLFTIVQFLAFSAVYYHRFRANERLRRLVYINAVIAVIVALADASFLDGILHSNSVSRSYTAAFLVAYTLLYLYCLFQSEDQQYNRYDPVFWVTIAILIYFANNVLYFIMRRDLLRYARDIESISYNIYMSLNIIAHGLYAYAFRCFNKWKAE